MAFRLTGDRVLIQQEKAEEKTVGGIYIPDNSQEEKMVGKVIRVGPGRLDANGKRVPVQISEGERVVFNAYSGTRVTIDGEVYRVMYEEEIHIVLTGKEEVA